MDEFQVNSIALRTLRQRCEYLQQRLNAVEEENCKLKLEKAQDLNSITPESSKLNERIIILNQEKSQMAHQIQMITNENSILWSQLSKMLPDNSISSLKISVPAIPDNQMLKSTQYDDISNDYSRESLEEISLKLINGIIMGKKELEKQYSQMVDLQRENMSETSSFTLKQIDNRVAAKNFKDYVQKLKDFKQALLMQKSELSSAITNIKNSQALSRQSLNVDTKDISNLAFNNYYRENNKNFPEPDSEFSTLHDPGRPDGEENLDSTELICPMCRKSFSGPFNIFNEHVNGHFNDDFVDARSN